MSVQSFVLIFIQIFSKDYKRSALIKTAFPIFSEIFSDRFLTILRPIV